MCRVQSASKSRPLSFRRASGQVETSGLYSLLRRPIPNPRYATSPGTCAHINPAVTLTAAAVGQLPWREAASYLPAQVAGGIAGTVLTNVMFGLPPAEISTTVRDAPITWLGDLVATVGLLSLIFTLVATRSLQLPALPPSVPTSPAPTTSPHPPASPTPPSPSAASSPTPSPASPPQSAAIFILTHLTASTLVTLGWRLIGSLQPLAVSFASPSLGDCHSLHGASSPNPQQPSLPDTRKKAE